MRKASKPPTLAEGLTLAPVKMGEFVANLPTAIATEAANKYVPPSLRKPNDSQPIVQNPKLVVTDTDFPSLGSTSSKKPPVVAAKINFKKAVDDHLEREKLSELERANLEDKESLNLTSAQLEAQGWVIIPLKRPILIAAEDDFEEDVVLVDDIHRPKRFSEEIEQEADRFFQNYLNTDIPETPFKIVKKIKSSTPLNDACMRYRAKQRL
jgi:hypothetical protein